MDKLAKDEKTGEYFTVYTEKPIMLISDDKKKWFVQKSPRELELETKLLEMESKLKQAKLDILYEMQSDLVEKYEDGDRLSQGDNRTLGFLERYVKQLEENKQ